VIFRPERDVGVEPLHSSPWLDALKHVGLSFQLLSLCLQGNGHTTLEDHVDLIHMIIVVRINPLMFSSLWLLCRGLL
jgi:hypothetical protein